MSENTTIVNFRPNRLLKLAEHLESGKLGHKFFDFSTVNSGAVDKRGCGTLGCAMGELPIVFPRSWHFNPKNGHDIDCKLANVPAVGAGSNCDVAWFFGIEFYEATDLFSPSSDIAAWNKRPLKYKATREQVAASIRRFVTWKTKQLAQQEPSHVR